MINLDTNVLLRFFVSDDEAQAATVRHLVAGELSEENPGYITLVVLAEVVWALRTGYATPFPEISAFLEQLTTSREFVVDRAHVVLEAISHTDSAADFTDTLIAALGRAAGCTETVTFDRRFAQQEGVRLLR